MNSVFQLPAELTIYSAGSTRDALLAWLTQQDTSPGDSVEIDAAQVDEIDGSGMQLLGALTATLTQRGLLWRVMTPSLQLLEACDVLGSRSWLKCATEAGSRT